MFSANEKMQAADALGLSECARAINCKFDGDQFVSAEVRALISSSLSANSTRAYRSDLSELRRWGGLLPWSPERTAEYLAAHAGTHKVATLRRRVASLAKAHRLLGAPDPTKTELVTATMRGIRRTLGEAQKQARPLLREDIAILCGKMDGSLKSVRDRALLLVGFASAFRRSELVSIDVDDIDEVRQGLVITLRASKTDQFREGRKIAIPYGRTDLCPVAALKTWLLSAEIEEGPIFRPVDRHSNVAPNRLSPDAVCAVVRERCAAAEYDPAQFSGHSLRAGLATSAAQAGASTLQIRKQTGHASDAMLARYIRDAELWIGNAAGAVL